MLSRRSQLSRNLPHDAQLGAVVFPPQVRCQLLGAIVVAREQLLLTRSNATGLALLELIHHEPHHVPELRSPKCGKVPPGPFHVHALHAG